MTKYKRIDMFYKTRSKDSYRKYYDEEQEDIMCLKFWLIICVILLVMYIKIYIDAYKKI